MTEMTVVIPLREVTMTEMTVVIPLQLGSFAAYQLGK